MVRSKSEILNEVFEVKTVEEFVDKLEFLVTVYPVQAITLIRQAMNTYGREMAAEARATEKLFNTDRHEDKANRIT